MAEPRLVPRSLLPHLTKFLVNRVNGFPGGKFRGSRGPEVCLGRQTWRWGGAGAGRGTKQTGSKGMWGLMVVVLKAMLCDGDFTIPAGGF